MLWNSSRDLIKICGVRREAEVEAAVLGGAQLVGLMFAPGSPRCLTPARAIRLRRAIGSRALAVGVFRDPAPAEVSELVDTLRLDAVQLDGNETLAHWDGLGCPLIKRVAPGEFDADAWPPGVLALLDPGSGPAPRTEAGVDPGTGWPDARRALVGGRMNPANVVSTILATRALGVDASAGVQDDEAGVKDVAAILAFCQRARAAFDQLAIEPANRDTARRHDIPAR